MLIVQGFGGYGVRGYGFIVHERYSLKWALLELSNAQTV